MGQLHIMTDLCATPPAIASAAAGTRYHIWCALYTSGVPLDDFHTYCVRKFGVGGWWDTNLPYILTDRAMRGLQTSLYFGEASLLQQELVVTLKEKNAVEITSRERNNTYMHNQGVASAVSASLQTIKVLHSQLIDSEQLLFHQPLLIGVQVECPSACAAQYDFTSPALLNMRVQQNNKLFSRESFDVYTPMSRPENSTAFFNTQFSSLYGTLTDSKHSPFFNNTSLVPPGIRSSGVFVVDTHVHTIPVGTDTIAVELPGSTTTYDIFNHYRVYALSDSSPLGLSVILSLDNSGSSKDTESRTWKRSEIEQAVVDIENLTGSVLQLKDMLTFSSHVTNIVYSCVKYQYMFLQQRSDPSNPTEGNLIAMVEAEISPRDTTQSEQPLYSNLQFQYIVPSSDEDSTGATILVSTQIENTAMFYVTLYNKENIQRFGNLPTRGMQYNSNIRTNYIMVKVPLEEMGFSNRANELLLNHSVCTIGFVPLTGILYDKMDIIGWSTLPTPPLAWEYLDWNLTSKTQSGQTISWRDYAQFTQEELTSLSILSGFPVTTSPSTPPLFGKFDGVLTCRASLG